MPKTILLVEDYDDCRAMMRFILEEWGYRVIEAGNGHDAVELVKEELPDLILMDMSMPEVDGLAATRRIKQIANADEIPVICVTAHGHYYEDKAIEAGCEEVVAKPVDFENLGEIVSQYLINH
jgi:CheY-like chemotaxis protein